MFPRAPVVYICLSKQSELYKCMLVFKMIGKAPHACLTFSKQRPPVMGQLRCTASSSWLHCEFRFLLILSVELTSSQKCKPTVHISLKANPHKIFYWQRGIISGLTRLRWYLSLSLSLSLSLTHTHTHTHTHTDTDTHTHTHTHTCSHTHDWYEMRSASGSTITTDRSVATEYNRSKREPTAQSNRRKHDSQS